MSCHMAIPHGWKNKAFLVNLGCIGDEVSGYAAGCTAIQGTSRQTLAPYYIRTILRIKSWRKSTSWTEPDCGNSGTADDKGKDWMQPACNQANDPF